ncbi:MAG: hypothetical protein ACFFCI_23055 [Promethearchaeota archaeon]
MNETTVLMHLLSKKINKFHIGATKEEILKILNLKGKNESIFFQDLIIHLSNYLEPIGLQIRFNPLNTRWYIAFETRSSDFISANPFEGKPRLAATLFCSLICCLENNGTGKVQDLKEIRKKKKIIDDLKELSEMGYLDLDLSKSEVRLTPLIGYQLDLNKLFTKFALKLKDLEK